MSRALTDPKTTPLLEEALRATCTPLLAVDDDGAPLLLDAVSGTFAVDSTSRPRAVGTTTREHGAEKPGPLPWLKCHT